MSEWSNTRHYLLLKSSSSNVFRPNPYSWRTKTYQKESTHNAKMYIISKTNYLSFTCRWGRCSGVAPACLVSVRQTIGICSRPPPPLGLGLSISLIFLYPEKCALLWPTQKEIKVKYPELLWQAILMILSVTMKVLISQHSLRGYKCVWDCDTGGELLNEPFQNIRMLNFLMQLVLHHIRSNCQALSWNPYSQKPLGPTPTKSQ